jgi:hypothetical protein
MPPAEPAGRLEWTNRISLATDRFMLYDTAKALFWCAVLIAGVGGVIALLMGGARASWEEWRSAFSVLAAVLAGIGLAILLVMLVLFGNRFQARFVLDRDGVVWESRSKMGAWGSRAAVVTGAMAGKPGLAGAGLLAQARSSISLCWPEVKRVRLHPRLCVISLMNRWRVVLRLYCTPLNYEEVRNAVLTYATGARVDGQAA